MPEEHVNLPSVPGPGEDQEPDPGAPMWRRALALSLRHPTLTGEALRVALATAPRGWWRRPPFLPLPDRGYLAWRTETAYGRPDAEVQERDLRHYLEWRRRLRRLR